MNGSARPWWRTDVVVGAILGFALIWAAFAIAGPKWGAVLTALLVLEAWTLTNAHPEDTISETLWRYAKRPMVPWMFGVASGWALASGVLSDPWLIGALFFLQGHFFFQKGEA